jgi:hypothetical protein
MKIMKNLQDLQSLSIEHLPRLSTLWQAFRNANNLQFSEYSFANAFLFRRQHHFKFIGGDFPLIRGEDKSGDYYYIPTCLPNNCLDIKKEAKGTITLFPVPEQWLSVFNDSHPQVVSYRQDSDYLYRVEKLKTFAGGALSSRRNLLHQFESQHIVESKPLTLHEREDALKILDEWQKHSQLSKEETDYSSCEDALNYLDRLGLMGRIVYAEGVPVGFNIGEQLTTQTAAIHLSKSLHAYKGVTPFLYQDFAKSLPAGTEWINLEQDLGLPALRQAKEAYEPDLLLPKYRVSF